MRSRVIRLIPLAVAAALALVTKSLRDRAVERHRAEATWLRESAVNFVGSRADSGTEPTSRG